jgi:hypothetical protein
MEKAAVENLVKRVSNCGYGWKNARSNAMLDALLWKTIHE